MRGTPEERYTGAVSKPMRSILAALLLALPGVWWGLADASASTDDAGHFTLKLLPGSYTLTASYSDTEDSGPAQPVTVEAGKISRIRLTVPDSVTETSGVVLTSRGEPADLPTGLLELQVRTSDGRCGKARVRLEPGQTGTLEIPVGDLGRVTGRLIQAPSIPRSGWVHVDLDTPQEREIFASKDGHFER
jgi:hypothetical protein